MTGRFIIWEGRVWEIEQSPWRRSIKKMFLKISQILQESTSHNLDAGNFIKNSYQIMKNAYFVEHLQHILSK